jgi:hypothetical protein
LKWPGASAGPFDAPVAAITIRPVPDTNHSRRCWFTFPTRTQVEQPIIWQMSRKFPDVTFDIRQASVQHEIGIMAVLLSGKEDQVNGAIEFLRSKGVTVEPIEKSVVEG